MDFHRHASPIRSLLFASSAALAMLLVAPGDAPAQSNEPQPVPSIDADMQRRFKEADLNHDGALTPAEAKAGGFNVEERFDSVDSDHNGTVTLFELGQYLTKSTRDWASGVDENGDGKVSAEEAKKNPSLMEIFKTADRNHDGLLTNDEYLAYQRSRMFNNVDLPSVVPNIIEKHF
jgi:Ca2+-binding EF-hand superfamily protein